jgi:hypothetical protein
MFRRRKLFSRTPLQHRGYNGVNMFEGTGLLVRWEPFPKGRFDGRLQLATEKRFRQKLMAVRCLRFYSSERFNSAGLAGR